MAVGKEIRTKIKSIKNTQKITRAMEMVAASKMRTAQERMRASRPYAERIRTIVGHLALAHPEYKHPFMIERDAKRIGIIIISTDRGLCGGLNTNVFKTAVMALREWRNKNDEAELKHHWDSLYEPEAKEALDDLLMRYIESLVYQGVVENLASEQAARMVAMKAASDNAGNFISDLQLVYNKARQAAITQEISEIVSGAAAV